MFVFIYSAQVYHLVKVVKISNKSYKLQLVVRNESVTNHDALRHTHSASFTFVRVDPAGLTALVGICIALNFRIYVNNCSILCWN